MRSGNGTNIDKLGLRRASRFAGRTSSRADDAVVELLGQTKPALISLASLLIGLGMLGLSVEKAFWSGPEEAGWRSATSKGK